MKRLFLLLALCLAACTSASPTTILVGTLVPTARATLAVPTSPPPTAIGATQAVVPTATDVPPSAPPPATPTAPEVPLALNLSLRRIADGFAEPVDLVVAPNDEHRLFVVEQPGRILILKDGQLLPEPFLDIRGLVNDRGNEQGLLGLVFAPDDPTTFFVNYIGNDSNTAVVRYTVAADDPNRADPQSAHIILTVSQPFPNHNGGDLAFGPDGYLYIGLGDGGAAGDPFGNAQNLDTLLGKMLRIDVRTDPYAIPPDNPFVNQAGVRPEIWAYGLRNPWRYTFDRKTGDLYIADVGQNAYEEVNVQPANSRGGENYGWDFMEGLHDYDGNAPAGLIAPLAEYSHDDGCSVTGGYVYRGLALPALAGTYLFGDYCSGKVWGSTPSANGWDTRELFEVPFNLSAFGEDVAGELYLLDHRGGVVYSVGEHTLILLIVYH